MTATANPLPRAHVAPRSNRTRGLWLAAMLALLAVLCALSVAVGTRDVGGDDIVAALQGQVDGEARPLTQGAFHADVSAHHSGQGT